MCSAPTSAWCSPSRVVRRAIALVLLAVAAGAGAESPSLAVRAAGPTLFESANRQTVSLALICESSEGAERPFIIVPRLPDSWKAVGGYDEFSLEAGVVDVRLVSFLVPWKRPRGSIPSASSCRTGPTHPLPRRAASRSSCFPSSPSTWTSWRCRRSCWPARSTSPPSCSSTPEMSAFPSTSRWTADRRCRAGSSASRRPWTCR